jgi:2-iminobutanoate/2-iminopropanoate deaminase
LHPATASDNNPENGTIQKMAQSGNGKGKFSRRFQHWRDFMAKDIIRTPNAPSPPPTYSQAVRAAGLVFVSGTGPHDPITGKIVGDTIQEQTRQCLENVSAILRAAGSSLERVVSATVILLEETDFAGMNEEWIKWFPTNPPARQGAKLPVRIPGMRVSIAAIAEA